MRGGSGTASVLELRALGVVDRLARFELGCHIGVENDNVGALSEAIGVLPTDPLAEVILLSHVRVLTVSLRRIAFHS